jgi:chromosomal replication initiation ATPase DnaA
MSEINTAYGPAQEAWVKVKKCLKTALGDVVFDSWFASVQIDASHTKDNVVCLSFATDFLARQVHDYHLHAVVRLFTEVFGSEIAVICVARSRMNPAPKPRLVAELIKPRPRMSVTRESLHPAIANALESSPDGVVEHTQDNKGDGLSSLDQVVLRTHEDTTLTGRLNRNFFPLLVSRWYKVPLSEIKSTFRIKDVVKPRQVGMYLARHFTTCSLPEIGRCFGGRDHTTVLHAINKYEELRQHDSGVHQELADFELAIKRLLSASEEVLNIVGAP